MIYKDQLNRELQLKETPKRIVSLVPSQTELLVDLGLENSIVGITKFCIHPKKLRQQKTIVGGTKNVNIEKIKALNPDIILCNKEENSLEIVESLNDIAPIHISDIYNLQDAYEMMRSYGQLFNVEEKASELINEIEAQWQSFQIEKNNKPLRSAAYFIWKNPWMVAASNTYINAMLNEAGFVNVFNAETRYPEISLHNKDLASAEILLLSSEPFPFKEKDILELKEIFADKQIVIVDGEMFSWYGSRLKFAFQFFKNL